MLEWCGKWCQQTAREIATKSSNEEKLKLIHKFVENRGMTQQLASQLMQTDTYPGHSNLIKQAREVKNIRSYLVESTLQRCLSNGKSLGSIHYTTIRKYATKYKNGTAAQFEIFYLLKLGFRKEALNELFSNSEIRKLLNLILNGFYTAKSDEADILVDRMMAIRIASSKSVSEGISIYESSLASNKSNSVRLQRLSLFILTSYFRDCITAEYFYRLNKNNITSDEALQIMTTHALCGNLKDLFLVCKSFISGVGYKYFLVHLMKCCLKISTSESLELAMWAYNKYSREPNRISLIYLYKLADGLDQQSAATEFELTLRSVFGCDPPFTEISTIQFPVLVPQISVTPQFSKEKGLSNLINDFL